MPKILGNSKVTEIDTSIKRINASYDSYDWTSDVHMIGLFTELKAVSKKLTIAIAQLKGESQLEEQDHVRDTDYRNFFYLVQGYLYNPIQSIKEAAQRLFPTMEKEGLAIIDDSYAVESSVIESIIEQFEVSSADDAISALQGAEELWEKLKKSQRNFEKAELAFEEIKAENKQNQSATEIKKEILPLFNKKVQLYINAMATVDEATYGEFARTVAQIIADNNSAVKKRRANKS
ncbi:MAG: hypothetical protein GY786_20875 [Proteobacteria bacterium]|nr:hypothetical protein [Pseudomonadota bacterium]